MQTSRPQLVLGIGSSRQVGKDTLFQRLNALSPRFRRFSMADSLKDHLSTFIHERFGVDVWTAEGEDKEMIRPILIAYGMCQRQRDASYWIKQVLYQIDEAANRHPDIIPVVTDVRFANEARYLRSHYEDAFRLIHLKRDGAPPPTEEEAKHVDEVAALADMELHWGYDTLEGQLTRAREICSAYGVEVG